MSQSVSHAAALRVTWTASGCARYRCIPYSKVRERLTEKVRFSPGKYRLLFTRGTRKGVPARHGSACL